MDTKKILLGVLVVAGILYYCRSISKFVVYGSESCGYTTKQVDYFKKEGTPHTFKDCNGKDSKECSEVTPRITKYPTTISGDTRYDGFTEIK